MISSAPIIEKNFRIVGQYRSSIAFLLVMGASPEECNHLLTEQIADWTHAELSEIRSAWIEEWDHCWVEGKEVSLCKHKQRAAMREYHASKQNTAGPSK